MDKKKLKDRYKEHANFVAAHCKATKVCFKDIIGYRINEKWRTRMMRREE